MFQAKISWVIESFCFELPLDNELNIKIHI